MAMNRPALAIAANTRKYKSETVCFCVAAIVALSGARANYGCSLTLSRVLLNVWSRSSIGVSQIHSSHYYTNYNNKLLLFLRNTTLHMSMRCATKSGC